MKKFKFIEPKTWHEGFSTLAVMIEAMHDDIRATAEQHGTTQASIADVKKTLGEHSEKLNQHTEIVGEVKTDLETVKEGVSELKHDVKQVKSDLKDKLDKKDFVEFKTKVLATGISL